MNNHSRQPKLRAWLLRFSLLLVLAASLHSCAVNPVTGRNELSLISTDQEIAMGQQTDPSIVAQFGLYQDDNLQQFINQKGMEMAKISHRPDLPWSFKVLDSPVVNAFAVPGGFIYFTRGIMAHFNNEAQFAGVLGHEIGHVTARHSAKQQSQALLAQLGLVAGMIAVPELAQYGDVATQGLGLLFLKFGRDAESQSDRLGVEYSTQVGYDAREMAGFFGTLDRLSGGAENRLPTFLSTHPNPLNRLENVYQLASEWQAKDQQTDYEVNRDGYLDLIDGIIYGEDPRQGYAENNVFYHPDLRFQFPYPQGWTLNNTPAEVQIAPQDGKALITLQLVQGSSPEAAAQQVQQNQPMTVINSNRTTINGLNTYILVADIESQNQQGQTQIIRMQSFFIQYGQYIYHLRGLALQRDFAAYQSYFNSTGSNFRELRDPDKINRKPERIDVVRVDQGGDLATVLKRYGIANDRVEEFAILNGARADATVQRGALIKVLERN